MSLKVTHPNGYDTICNYSAHGKKEKSIEFKTAWFKRALFAGAYGWRISLNRFRATDLYGEDVPWDQVLVTVPKR